MRCKYDPVAMSTWMTVRSRIIMSELATHIGITPPAVSNWRAVPEKYLKKTSEWLMIPPQKLRPDLRVEQIAEIMEYDHA